MEFWNLRCAQRSDKLPTSPGIGKQPPPVRAGRPQSRTRASIFGKTNRHGGSPLQLTRAGGKEPWTKGGENISSVTCPPQTLSGKPLQGLLAFFSSTPAEKNFSRSRALTIARSPDPPAYYSVFRAPRKSFTGATATRARRHGRRRCERACPDASGGPCRDVDCL